MIYIYSNSVQCMRFVLWCRHSMITDQQKHMNCVSDYVIILQMVWIKTS